MALIWDNPQRYSNQSIGQGGLNSDGLPGFWFGPRIVPKGVGTGSYNTTLTATAQLTPFQPVYNLAMMEGSRITMAGDQATVMMDLPDSDIKAVVTLSYVGQFSYKEVLPPTPATIGEFQMTDVSFVDGNNQPLAANATTGTSALAQAVATGKGYLYLQLLPQTGTASVAEINPATPGSPVTLNNTAWDYDTAAPNLDITCFLPGAMVTTIAGPKAVETLQVGDLVLTGLPGQQKLEPVTWTGRGRAEVRPHLPDDRAGYPVCLRKGALAPHCPDADLWLTPEHTLYFNGHLVPVRMLVNHRSIFYDRSHASYDYYHFETEQHSLVHVSNMTTETYLDTGNRYSFQSQAFLQKGNVVTLPTRKSWEKDACAPLGTSAELVRPLHRALEARARALGHERQVPLPVLTHDSDFHIVTDRGEVLHAIRRVRDRALFLLPASVTALQLRSRTSRPCDSIGPYMDDRRQLGVLLGTIELYQNGETRHLTSHLRDPAANGWDVVEDSPCRWTNGNATLSLADMPPIEERDMLAVQILEEGPYIESAPSPVPTIALPRMRLSS